MWTILNYTHAIKWATLYVVYMYTTTITIIMAGNTKMKNQSRIIMESLSMLTMPVGMATKKTSRFFTSCIALMGFDASSLKMKCSKSLDICLTKNIKKVVDSQLRIG